MRLTPRNHWRDGDKYIVNTLWGKMEVDPIDYYVFKAGMFAIFCLYPVVFILICLLILWEKLS